MHLKRIFWNSWIKTNEGILDVHVMRIQNAFRYAHPFRILDAHSIRILDAYLMRISIASTYSAHWNAFETHLKGISGDGQITFHKSIIDALIERIWKAFKYAHSFRILDAHSVRIVGAHCISIYFLYIYFHNMKKEFLSKCTSDQKNFLLWSCLTTLTVINIA